GPTREPGSGRHRSPVQQLGACPRGAPAQAARLRRLLWRGRALPSLPRDWTPGLPGGASVTAMPQRLALTALAALLLVAAPAPAVMKSAPLQSTVKLRLLRPGVWIHTSRYVFPDGS